MIKMVRQFVKRHLTYAELLYLRHRVHHLARIGADATELADAAVEYFYYERMHRHHKPDQTMHYGAYHPTMHIASRPEANEAFHSFLLESNRQAHFTSRQDPLGRPQTLAFTSWK